MRPFVRFVCGDRVVLKPACVDVDNNRGEIVVVVFVVVCVALELFVLKLE